MHASIGLLSHDWQSTRLKTASSFLEKRVLCFMQANDMLMGSLIMEMTGYKMHLAAGEGKGRTQVHDLASSLLQKRCVGLGSSTSPSWPPLPEMTAEGALPGVQNPNQVHAA